MYVFPGRKLPVRITDPIAFGAILTRFTIAVTRPFTLALVISSPLPLLGSIFVVTMTVFAFWQLLNRTKEKIVL